MGSDFVYAQQSTSTSPALMIIPILFALFAIICQWIIFAKAGEPGIAAIIPIWNLYTAFKIAFGNGWKFLFLLIPFVNFVFMILYFINLAKVFGKGAGFGLGLLFLSPIFMAILAFDKNIQYVGAN